MTTAPVRFGISAPGGRDAAPYPRLLIADWYDGPLAGIVESQPGSVHAFQMVVWDESTDYRVFVLGRLPASAFAEAEPFSRVALAWERPDAEREAAWQGITRIMDAAGEPEYLVVVDYSAGTEVIHPLADDALRARVRALAAQAPPDDPYYVSERWLAAWRTSLGSAPT